MAQEETQTVIQEVAFEWLRIASGVAQGLLAPEEGVVMLQALADACPADCDWLQEEIKTLRYQFGLDIADAIRNKQGSYWDKLLSVVEALLDERIDHAHALELLAVIDDQHPEHTQQTTTLISDIVDSPLRQFLKIDDQ
jgi:hypothetical protein